MGNIPTKLGPDLTTSRETPSRNQRQYPTSSDDPMARESRGQQASDSDSLPDITSFEGNPNSSTRKAPGIPLRQEDQSHRVEARSASKRGRRADTQAEATSKRSKHTKEVLCPTPRLVVKLKIWLTREKMPQGARHQYSGANIDTPAHPTPSNRPIGCESLIDGAMRHNLPPTHQCHASSFTLQPPRREDPSTSSSQYGHSHPPESDNAADISSTNVLTTDMSAHIVHSVTLEDVSGDTGDREKYLRDLQELEDHNGRQNAAATISAMPIASRQTNVENQTQASENANDTPAAASTKALNDESGHSAAPEANTTSAKVDQPSNFTHPTKEASPSAEAVPSIKDVLMSVSIQRKDQAEPKVVSTITLQNIVSGGGFFEIIPEDLGNHLGEDETVIQADVKRSSGPPIPGLKTEFSLIRASKRNVSLELLLRGLERIYQSNGKCVELELDACLLVKKGSDEKQVA